MDRARFRGALLGLAAGDAVGTTVEFQLPGSFPEVTDMTGGGPFSLPVGAWTDDTSMALCLAESLVLCDGFDPVDQLSRYRRWYREGYLSSTGTCFDIGNSTRAAIERFERTGEPFPGDADPDGAGNGPLMKLAPVPMAFAGSPDDAVLYAAESARTTHGAPQAADACVAFTVRFLAELTGARIALDHPLHPEVAEVWGGSWLHRSPPEIKGSGYVVRALEAALWALHKTTTFEGAVLAAVNLGDDADTTAAIVGQLAGARYGVGGIPAAWLDQLVMRERIEALADALWVMAIGGVPGPDASWSELSQFGSAFDGYAYWGDDWGSRYREMNERRAASGAWEGSLEDLQATLFVAFRADRHGGYPPEPGSSGDHDRRALVAEIGRRLRYAPPDG